MKTRIAMILAIGLIGSAYSADQYWNGVDTTTGWDTTSSEWGATAGADVGQTWVNGNNAFIAGAGGLSAISEDISINNLTYSGTNTSMNFNGGKTITVNGTIDAGTKGFRFGGGIIIDGTFTTSNGLNTFASGSQLSGTATLGSRLIMTVGSSLSGNVVLTSNGTLGMRWSAGQNQTMSTPVRKWIHRK